MCSAVLISIAASDTALQTRRQDGPPELPHTVKQHALTGATVHYECRQCHTALHSKLAEAGERENCPQCGVGFIVPGLQAKTDEAMELAAQNKAAIEADRMKRAAQRIEQHRQRPAETAPPSPEQPPSATTRFFIYEIAGAVLFLLGLLVVLVADTSIHEVYGAVGIVGGLLLMAIAGVGSVLCYCAARLYELTQTQGPSADTAPPPPRKQS